MALAVRGPKPSRCRPSIRITALWTAAGVRPSAGWATTSTVGYDLSALIYLSREAAAFADDKGGDRWERVSATVVERMLTQALRS